MTQKVDLTKDNDFGVGCWNADNEQWEITVNTTEIDNIPTNLIIRDEIDGPLWNAYLYSVLLDDSTQTYSLIYKEY